MINSFTGTKSINLVGKSDVVESTTIKTPLDNVTIYEYTKQSSLVTSENDQIKVKIVNKTKTEKYDNWYVQVGKARVEGKPTYSQPTQEETPVIVDEPLEPSKPSPTTTPPPPAPGLGD